MFNCIKQKTTSLFFFMKFTIFDENRRERSVTVNHISPNKVVFGFDLWQTPQADVELKY